MTEDISDRIHAYFSKEFDNALAMNLDEPVPAVSKAIKAIIPTVLTAVATKIHSGKEEGDRIFGLASEASGYYPKGPDVAKLQNVEEGSSLPLELFGNNEHHIARHIAAWSGVRPGSAEQLITLVTPVVMGMIGENYSRRNLTSSEFRSEFTTNDEVLRSLLPAGYRIPEVGTPLTSVGEDTSKIHEADLVRNKTNFVFPKWIPVAVVILVVIMLIYFSRL